MCIILAIFLAVPRSLLLLGLPIARLTGMDKESRPAPFVIRRQVSLSVWDGWPKIRFLGTENFNKGFFFFFFTNL